MNVSNDADSRVEALIGRSALGAAGDRVVRALVDAWCSSATRRAVRGFGDAVPSSVERMRFAGIAIGAAAAVALILQRFAMPLEPLAWIVPALALFAGVSLVAWSNRAERRG